MIHTVVRKDLLAKSQKYAIRHLQDLVENPRHRYNGRHLKSALAVYSHVADSTPSQAKAKLEVLTQGAACHFSLRRCKNVQALVTCPYIEGWDCSEEQGIDWINWLIKESPWRDAFITKVFDEQRQLLVMDVTKPSNYVVQACIATRLPREYPQRLKVWHDSVAAGADPDIMAVAMEFLSRKGTQYWGPSSPGDGHDMWRSYSLSKAGLSNFVHLKPLHPNPSLLESGEYAGIHGLWSLDSSWFCDVVSAEFGTEEVEEIDPFTDEVTRHLRPIKVSDAEIAPKMAEFTQKLRKRL